MDPDALKPSKVFESLFLPIWQESDNGLKGKQKLLRRLNSMNVYSKSSPKLSKSVLLVLEHQLAFGKATAGTGGYIRRWGGTFSTEHILPQVCRVTYTQQLQSGLPALRRQ